MNKKITLYELLGLVKDGKAPKKVLILDKVYYLLQDGDKYIYSQNSHNLRDWDMFIDNKINVSQCLDDEVLILDEEYEVEILDDEDKNSFTGWKMYQNGKEVVSMDCSYDEDKEIEEIKYYDDSIAWVIDGAGQLSDIDKITIDKINELVRKINKLKKEGK